MDHLMKCFGNWLTVSMCCAGSLAFAQSPPNFSISVSPTAPVTFDTIVATLSSLNPCSIDENSIRVTQTQTNIRIDVNALSNCVPTGGGAAFDVMLGKLAPGSYTASVFQPQPVQVASVQFTVADKYASSVGAHPLVDYTDHWWNSQESGWGLSIMQHTSDRLFATWYVYDQSMQPTWYTLQPGSWTNFKTYTGPIYRTTGPYFGGPFNPTQVNVVQVGAGTLTFADAAHAEFSYSISGVASSKAITRLPF